MKRIVYLSQMSRPMPADELSELLNGARVKNHSAELSGVLIVHKDQFFQVLEGPEAAVRTCFNRIAADPRHCNLRVVEVSDAKTRAFPEWRMGFQEPQELQPEQRGAVFSVFDLVPPNSEFRGDDVNVRNYIRTFLAGFQRLNAA